MDVNKKFEEDLKEIKKALNKQTLSKEFKKNLINKLNKHYKED